ncbi:hypothetical protein D9619_007203 [Psilocybe cf. subviscida]|uniref:Uncharacterized protein n=1 Tax=Psilocybe cf. subviscida TaxID=2480587 RepID=A0A8H5B1J4_9AGAR|nr:hypothetical protein D9619_007203 [Psilocybe cf. subviscida]
MGAGAAAPTNDDCTGSQDTNISSATKNVESICAHDFESGKLQAMEDLRVVLVAFCGHPPQDHTYITKNLGFSNDISAVHKNLSTLDASSGACGGAEYGLEGVCEQDGGAYCGCAAAWHWGVWRCSIPIPVAFCFPLATTNGLALQGSRKARQTDTIPCNLLAKWLAMVSHSEAHHSDWFFIACEPALSGYSHATDFYQALTSITSGLMLPLLTADLLTHAIAGSVLENLDMERLVRKVGSAVAQRILGNNESVDDVARELHGKLLLRNESTKKVVIESIYRESEEAKHNVAVFTQAGSLKEAVPQLKRVSGTRFTEKYLNARHAMNRSSYSSYTSYSSARNVPASPVKPVVPPSSPPRKVVTDFAAFGAPKTASVFGTKVAQTPFSLAGGKAAFGGMRMGGGARAFDEDEGEEEEEPVDDGRQKVELREDSISLDQARRIAMQSAWRSARS